MGDYTAEETEDQFIIYDDKGMVMGADEVIAGLNERDSLQSQLTECMNTSQDRMDRRDEMIASLRSQLDAATIDLRKVREYNEGLAMESHNAREELEAVRVQLSKAITEIRLSGRQYRHNTEPKGFPDGPQDGFVFAYDADEVDRVLANLDATLRQQAKEVGE